jgi:hypothetical protein
MRTDRLTTKTREALQAAQQIAAEMGNPEMYLAALREVRGSQRVTGRPGGHLPGAREVLQGPHEPRPLGQARPRHRPRRGDPPGDAGALAPHQEQPRAHRRARRGQDRHRRGHRPAHRPRRRPESLKDKRISPSTGARWWRAASIEASSRIASRPCSRRSSRRNGDIILFIDELHTLVGAGAAEGSMDASNMLKPPWRAASCAASAPPPSTSIASASRRTRRWSGASSRCFVGQPTRRGHHRHPPRAQGALRGAPRHPHPGRGARGRGDAVQPLHHRALPCPTRPSTWSTRPPRA